MRVHPVRTGNRSIVVRLNGAVCDRWGLRPGETILCPGWELSMPMDKRAGAGFVDEIYAETLARGKANAGLPVGTCQPEDLGWPAVHLQDARSRNKTLGSSRRPATGFGEDRHCGGGKRSVQKPAA